MKFNEVLEYIIENWLKFCLAIVGYSFAISLSIQFITSAIKYVFRWAFIFEGSFTVKTNFHNNDDDYNHSKGDYKIWITMR